SPLHRGRYFNRSSVPRRMRSEFFQSPLHRGRYFNFTFSTACRAWRSEAFSPLFIGEGTSTCVPPPGWAPRTFFQSPLHRGRYFNGASHRMRRQVAADTFSPLFIGEGTSTVIKGCAVAIERIFQSPLHRGRYFNWCSYTSRRLRDELSVPSSSGKVLQQPWRLFYWERV